MKLYPFTIDCDCHGVSAVVRRHKDGNYGSIWQAVCGLLHCCCYQDWIVILPDGTRLTYYEARKFGLIHMDDDTTDSYQNPRPTAERVQLPPGDR